MSIQTQSTDKRQILFVDDDAAFLNTVGMLFQAYTRGTWGVHMAANATEALAILEQNPVDLVVIDLRMPVVDGDYFLQFLHRRFPSLAKVVFTGFGTAELRAATLEHGADLFLEKPCDATGFERIFATLQELANWQIQGGFRGLLRQVGLSNVLQMECLSKNSSIIQLSSPQLQGRIFIEEGSIVHAEAGQESGEQAFYKLFSLADGSFSLKSFESPPQRSIEVHWEFLLMEATRKKDEEAGDTMMLTAAEGRQSDDGPAAEAAQDQGGLPAEAQVRRIDEVMVCSERDEVLYAWQCRDIESRMKLLRWVEQKAEQMAQRLPLGLLDRLEIEGPTGRVVTQFQADRTLWVRSNSLHAPEVS